MMLSNMPKIWRRSPSRDAQKASDAPQVAAVIRLIEKDLDKHFDEDLTKGEAAC